PQDIWIAVCGQADDFSFMPVRPKAKRARDMLIKLSERVGKRKLVKWFNAGRPANVDSAAISRPVTIERDQQRFVESGAIKCVGCVRVVMFETAELRGQAKFGEPFLK